MRDAVFLLLVLGGSLAALRRPWIGVMMWTVVSLMNPHAQYGYAAAYWPIASVVALSTMLGLLLTRERQNPFVGFPVWALLLLCLWVTITLPFSLYFDESLPLWERSMKIWLMVFVTLALIDDRRKLHLLIGTMVFSLAFYGVKGGLFTLATGGNYLVWGPGGFIGGNNELALALIMTVPLMRYLQTQTASRARRWLWTAAMLLCAVTALGTHSRGALLGLAAMGFYFWVKGPQKLLSGAAILLVALLVLPFMPEHWWMRMDTIAHYQQDDSALGRINAWWNAWNIAKDRLFGGGFMIYFPEVFARYSPEPLRVHAAHSIYFQMMGEHGFIGLLLFLLVGASTWWSASQLIRAGRAREEDRWCAHLGAMVQVSMVGYAVTGAFLSLAYYDLPYNLMTVTVLALHLVRRRRRQEAAASASVGEGVPRAQDAPLAAPGT